MEAMPLLIAAMLGLAASMEGPAQDGRFDGATAWLNSPPLRASDRRGKVVLVEFWTYTCINWLRTMPYVRAWTQKYKDQGLVVIGVHTPEFPFEHDLENIQRAVKEMEVPFAVAVDSDYKVWRAFGNNAWPAIYLIDTQGTVRYRHLGEGEYDTTEKAIQQLLAEGGRGVAGRELVSAEGRGAEVAADWTNLQSPETYLGSDRSVNFASHGGTGFGQRRMYEMPSRLARNYWALTGDWTMKDGSVLLNKPNGRIAYRFHARDVHLVMGPAKPGTSVRFRVLIDGKPPGAAHGSDVDEQGVGVLGTQRLYQLIRQPGAIADRTFEIEFLDSGAEAFAFTFG